MILTFLIPVFVPWIHRVISGHSDWYPNEEWRANHPWRIYLSGLEAARQLGRIHLPNQALVRPPESRNNSRTEKGLLPNDPKAVFLHPWLELAPLATTSGQGNSAQIRAADTVAESLTEGRNLDMERGNGLQATIPMEPGLLHELPESHSFSAVEYQRNIHPTDVAPHHLSADGVGTDFPGGDDRGTAMPVTNTITGDSEIS